jgi:hypothetical protein
LNPFISCILGTLMLNVPYPYFHITVT